jgi:FMN phosphatase YigB (HAD superfamily)
MTSIRGPGPGVLLWDLDGTIAYWRSLRIIGWVSAAYLARLGRAGFLPKGLPAAARAFRRMLRNAGTRSNDDLFNGLMARSLGCPPQAMHDLTRAMIEAGDLDAAIGRYIRAIPEGLALVRDLAATGQFRQVIATSPVMPALFNRRRLGLAEFDNAWFEFVTGSEFFRCQKDSPRFFADLVAHLGVTPQECLMIGNDTGKDLQAGRIGISTWLIVNEHTRRRPGSEHLVPDHTGTYDELRRFLTAGGSW